MRGLRIAFPQSHGSALAGRLAWRVEPLRTHSLQWLSVSSFATYHSLGYSIAMSWSAGIYHEHSSERYLLDSSEGPLHVNFGTELSEV